MKYTSHYHSPPGNILLEADEYGLTGVWFDGYKHFAPPSIEIPVFAEAKRWLDIYFSGREPDFTVPIHFTGTAFQNQVRELLCTVPYGKTTTYGAIAKALSSSAQSVGGALGRNRILIFVPCHRVIGSDGSLTGYAGGLDRKNALLELERMNNF